MAVKGCMASSSPNYRTPGLRKQPRGACPLSAVEKKSRAYQRSSTEGATPLAKMARNRMKSSHRLATASLQPPPAPNKLKSTAF